MDDPRPSLSAPLLVWLLIQLAALGVGAYGLPLSAESVRPAEAMSAQVMLTVQIAAAAVLWPMLFGSWRVALAVMATALPFTQAAGFLSATPTGRLLAGAGILLLWLGSLAALPAQRIGPLPIMVVRAILVLWSVGGALLAYLRAEFTGTAAPAALAGPIVWGLSESSAPAGALPWICSGAVFTLCVLTRVTVHQIATDRVPRA